MMSMANGSTVTFKIEPVATMVGTRPFACMVRVTFLLPRQAFKALGL